MLMSATFLISALIQFALGLVAAWILGAAEFGAYALALSAAVLVQTLVFEWIRLAATRFHHANAGRAFQRRMMRALLWLAGGMALAAGIALVAAEGRARLIALVPVLAAIAGYADIRAAILRAEFRQRLYAQFMLMRNLFALVLLPAAAAAFGRAELALAAFGGSIALASVFLEWRLRAGSVAEKSVEADGFPAPDLFALLRYSAPIVATNALYLALFFVLRLLAAAIGGLASAGQLSLALDFVLKLFSTAGTAFDLALFQLALRDSRVQGEAAGEARVRQNFGWLLVLVAPMVIGLAFVVGALEPYLVSPAFRGAFGGFVHALLPGVALYAMIQYGLHAHFQLKRQTGPLMVAAALAFAVVVLGLAATMTSAMPVSQKLGGVLGAGMAAAGGYLLLSGARLLLPDLAFWGRLGLALGAMSAVTYGASRLGAGPVALAAMIVGGGASYALAVWLADPGGLRAAIGRR